MATIPEPVWVKVDEYTDRTLRTSDPELSATVRASEEAHLPPIQVAPNQGKLLHLLARAIAARRILEIGTLGGYSTLWLARALPPEGRLLSLEIDPRHADVARENLRRAGVLARVEIRVGRALDSLRRLEEERAAPFDFVFVDADKPTYPEYLAFAERLARPGALILIDNVVRGGAVCDANDPDPNVRGVRTMNEGLASSHRLDATTVQTVGVKGYDGFTLALVRGDGRASAAPSAPSQHNG